MKAQVATFLIVIALMAGAGAGYLWDAGAAGVLVTTTRTMVFTTTIAAGSRPDLCIVTAYSVWRVETAGSNSTGFGTSTQSYPAQTYGTSISGGQAPGFATTFTSYPPGTMTGAIARWNSTVCTYLSG